MLPTGAPPQTASAPTRTQPRPAPGPGALRRLLLVATISSIVSTIAFILYVFAPRRTSAELTQAHPYYIAGLVGLAIAEACQLLGILVLIGRWASHYNTERRFREILVLIISLIPFVVIVIFLWTLFAYLRARRQEPTSTRTQEAKEKLKDKSSNVFVDAAAGKSQSAATSAAQPPAPRPTMRDTVRRVVGPSTQRSLSDAGSGLAAFTMIALVLATIATFGAITPAKNLVSRQIAPPGNSGSGAGGGQSGVTSGGKAGTFKAVSLPGSKNIPAGITTGPDGNLWLASPCGSVADSADCNGTVILRVTPSGQLSSFPITTTGDPEGIAVGPDGNLWFGLYRVNAASSLASITPSGTVTEYPQRVYDEATSIVAGPDGAMWFTESERNSIGRITTTGLASFFPLSSNLYKPSGIAVGPDGNLWFTVAINGGGAAIGRITTGGVITEFDIPNSQTTLANGAASLGIAKGADGKLWFTDGNAIGSITTDGQISVYPLPDSTNQARSITTGPDGDAWFTACTPYNGNNGNCIHIGIGHVASGGKITMYPIPISTVVPSELTVGPDKNLWFTEPFSNEMGYFVP